MSVTTTREIAPLVSDLKPQSTVVLYPTFGHRAADGKSWHLGVSGVVFRPGSDNLRRRMLVRVLQRLMNATPSELNCDRFRTRVSRFLVSTERGRRIAVRVGDSIQMLQRPSRRNGHFRGSLVLEPEATRQLLANGEIENGWLSIEVATPFHGVGPFVGQAQLIGDTGLSVISDIDDTIKHSEVGDRRKLLQNTFLNEFRPVPGMAEVYQRWARGGAAFHYVSSSPWQLYECLGELLSVAGFPPGSFHLRAIRLRDPSVLKLFVARRTSKRRVINSIIRMFPRRRFVLIGDSGEKDPEIYGSMARRFPQQVEQIVIRKIAHRSSPSDRWQRVFRGIPGHKIRVFADPSELYDLPWPQSAAKPPCVDA